MSRVFYLKCTFLSDNMELKPRKLNFTEETEIKSQSQWWMESAFLHKLSLSALCNCDWSGEWWIGGEAPSFPCDPLILLLSPVLTIWFHYYWLDETRHARSTKVDQWRAVKILMTELDQTFFPPRVKIHTYPAPIYQVMFDYTLIVSPASFTYCIHSDRKSLYILNSNGCMLCWLVLTDVPGSAAHVFPSDTDVALNTLQSIEPCLLHKAFFLPAGSIHFLFLQILPLKASLSPKAFVSLKNTLCNMQLPRMCSERNSPGESPCDW